MGIIRAGLTMQGISGTGAKNNQDFDTSGSPCAFTDPAGITQTSQALAP